MWPLKEKHSPMFFFFFIYVWLCGGWQKLMICDWCSSWATGTVVVKIALEIYVCSRSNTSSSTLFKALRNGSEWHQYADPCSICFHIHLGSLGPASGWHWSIVLSCKDGLASFYKAATSAGGRTFSQSVPTGSNKEEFCEPHCQCL